MIIKRVVYSMIVADVKKSCVRKYLMQLQRTIIVVLIVASLAHVDVCCSTPFQEEKSDAEDRYSVSSDFERMAFSLPLPRENQTGSKTAGPAGLPRLTPIASDCLSAKNRLFYAANIESSHLTTNEHTLVSLHCLLTV